MNSGVNSKCCICNGQTFTYGPRGRLSAYGHLPYCTGCYSLERHRAFREVWDVVRTVRNLYSYSALQISDDAVVPRDWFDKYEVSVYGESNSIDIQSIKREDRSYDVVICNHVLEHVADDKLALRELMRIVSDRGFLQLSVPDPFRRKVTEDWGYPKLEDHGHYRIYGQDIIELLRESLPGCYLLTVVAQDSVTKSEDVVFFVSRNYELRYLYPYFQVKSFQLLSAQSMLPDLEVLSRSSFTINSSKAPRCHVYYWPDYTLTNPYQTLLGKSLSAPLTCGSGDVGLAIRALIDRPQDAIIFHQHWTGAVFTQASSLGDAMNLLKEHCDRIQRFKELGGKVIWTVHNAINHEGVYADVEIELCRFLADAADVVHVHSLSTIDLTSHIYQIPKEKVVEAPHGNYVGFYDNTIGKSSARSKLGIPNDAKVILFFGQIRRYKGIRNLIDAFLSISSEESLPYLLIVGDPGVMSPAELNEICVQHERIKYHFQHVPDGDVQIYFNCADVCILPYQNVLTSGSVLLAMSFGCPVVGPDLGLLRGIISHGVSGWLYNPNDNRALVDTLGMVLDLPREQLRRVTDQCRENIKRYDWDFTGRTLTEAIVAQYFGRVHLVETTDKHRCLIRTSFNEGSPDRKRTAAIILHFENLEDTYRCIESLQRQEGAQCDLCVVSNDDDIEAYIYLCKRYPNITVIQSPRNLGYAGGNNLALMFLKDKGYDFFWLVNPDIVCSPIALSEFERAADNNRAYSGFGPIIFFGDRPEVIWYGGGEVVYDGFEPRHSYHNMTIESLPKVPWQTSYVTGASLFFRSEMLDRVGFLPEDFFLYFEETYWCLNALDKGYRFLVLPSVHLWHHKRSEVNGAPTLAYIYYFSRNWILMCSRRNPGGLQQALSKLQGFSSRWLKLVEDNRPNEREMALRASVAGVEDGLAGKTGWVDLDLRLRY